MFGCRGSCTESSLSDKEEEQKKVKARSDSPWSNAMKGQERLGAVVAGLGRLFAKVQSREGLAEERERMVECLQLVARTTADPVRDQALKYADEAGDRCVLCSLCCRAVVKDGARQVILQHMCR